MLKDHPTCCFCGGGSRAATVDHVPPKACFPPGFFPEGFEFPACERCNSSTKKHDQIFSYYVQLADHDSANRDFSALHRLAEGIRNNYAAALPDLKLSAEKKRAELTNMGLLLPEEADLSSIPLVGVSEEFLASAQTIGRKLGCALYYRETANFLTGSHFIWTAHVHLMNPRSETITDYLRKLLPEEVIGGRSNIRNFGQRFGYKSGYKQKDDFFVCACQFGKGFVVMSIVGDRSRDYADIPAGEKHPIFPAV